MYAGTIRHRRFAEREHAFRHRIALAYRDLDTVRGFMSRAEVSRLVGEDLDGPIRLLAAPRSLGILFNPVSFYYCFDGEDCAGSSPRSRTRRGAIATPTSSRPAAGRWRRRCTCRRSWRWTTRTTCA